VAGGTRRKSAGMIDDLRAPHFRMAPVERGAISARAGGDLHAFARGRVGKEPACPTQHASWSMADNVAATAAANRSTRISRNRGNGTELSGRGADEALAPMTSASG
jgi:hypothetical protein